MSKNRRMIEGQLSLFDITEAAGGRAETAGAAQNVLPADAGPIKQGAPQEARTFPECVSCWCRDCRHNGAGEGVPRELCGRQMPCPACEPCVRQQAADICVIGSAKEGCGVRAREEGIAP